MLKQRIFNIRSHPMNEQEISNQNDVSDFTDELSDEALDRAGDDGKGSCNICGKSWIG